MSFIIASWLFSLARTGTEFHDQQSCRTQKLSRIALLVRSSRRNEQTSVFCWELLKMKRSARWNQFNQAIAVLQMCMYDFNMRIATRRKWRAPGFRWKNKWENVKLWHIKANDEPRQTKWEIYFCKFPEWVLVTFCRRISCSWWSWRKGNFHHEMDFFSLQFLS